MTHQRPPLYQQRLPELQSWAKRQLGQGQATEHTIALPKNASFRRYYRLKTRSPPFSVLAVDSAPEFENNADFIALSGILSDLNIPVPRVIAHDMQRGFLLVDDLGDHTLEKALASEKSNLLYESALTTLVDLQSHAKAPVFSDLPTFGIDSMQAELNNCQHWFLEKLLGLTLDSATQDQLTCLFTQITSALKNQATTLMHRDYQCRNVMWVAGEKIALLDFQDLCFGPASYDVVSLLWDCYLDWPGHTVKSWLWFYYQAACEKQIILPMGFATFTQHCDWAILQRHLKNTFIFARKYLRDDEPLYLSYLPRTVSYINNALQACLGRAPICCWWQQVVRPALYKCYDQFVNNPLNKRQMRRKNG